MKYGLIGEKLGHSHSPRIHKLLGNAEYRLVPLSKKDLDLFMRSKDFAGINVTIPYKKDVIPYCDFLSDEAREIGSVNTVIHRDGRLFGYNTDCFGLSELIRQTGVMLTEKKVIILGSGGTSLTAHYVAKQQNAAEIVVVSRHGENNYGNITAHHDADVIINTTPVGMYPNNGAAPIDLSLFGNLSGVTDVIYNPVRSALVIDAIDRGIPASGGLAMLVYQAAKAHQLFLSEKKSDLDNTNYVYNKILKEVSNIILIGMPGSGKTTIGKLLAKKMNRRFIDTDHEIVKKENKSIPEIFARDGEAYFRRIESDIISDICKCSGTVISVGGGGVLCPENRMAIRQNGIIIHITRPVQLLGVEGRPLSKSSEALSKMQSVRQPVYQELCDFEIENIKPAEYAVDGIIRKIGI